MMRPAYKLLVTDLDNTLYDWVSFFATAFGAMASSLAQTLDVDQEQILDEFQSVHQELQSLEQPFTLFRLPSVRARYPGATPAELKVALDGPLHAFNHERAQRLRLYDGVRDTLARLKTAGVRLVAHTDASSPNAVFRLRSLEVLDLFDRLYVAPSQPVDYPDPDRVRQLAPPAGLVVHLEPGESKPNPDVLRKICAREGFVPTDAVYLGDSIARDVAMARAAGVISAWARYGTLYDPKLWSILVRVTHWSDEDVRREAELRRQSQAVTPDFTLDGFPEILPIFALSSQPGA